MASATPAPALVLKAARRLRTEFLKLWYDSGVQKQVKASGALFASRDNLTLYTRLVRLQVAAYHSTSVALQDHQRDGGNATRNRADEPFEFVPPSESANRAASRVFGSRRTSTGSNSSDTQNTPPSDATSKDSTRYQIRWSAPLFGGPLLAPKDGSSSASSADSAQSASEGANASSNKSSGTSAFASSASRSAGAGSRSTRHTESARARSSGSERNASSGTKNEPSWPAPGNPIPVSIVPSKLNWLNWLLSFMILVFIAYIWFSNSGSGGSAGPLSGLLNSRFEIAEPSDLTFDDVKGNVEAKEELFDVVEYLRDPVQFSELGIKIPKGILLTGPPGTGKTMLARVVASESGVPFISTNGAEFEEMLVGVGARRVRQLFELARKNAPCIVFIDEIDAVGSKREEFNSSHHRMSINQLLVEMDGFSPSEGIVVIGATNLSEVLDPALVRPGRFDRKVTMELPDPKARKDILDHYLKGRKLAPDVSTGTLARAAAGFSGADLETMVNWAAIISSKQKTTTITMKMLEEALFNVAMGRERRSLVLNDHTRKLCAYHESGHALVSLYTPGSMDIRRATLVPRGSALGMVNYLSKEDSPLTTKEELLARMDTAMGGRAAEELIYGTEQITQGAGSDFEQATKIATAMVMQLGMSPRLGPVFLPSDPRARISPETQLIVEEETRRLLAESYQRAFNILSTHHDELHNLANALLKYESLTVDEIRRAIKGDPLLEKEAELAQNRIREKLLEEQKAAERLKRQQENEERRERKAAKQAERDRRNKRKKNMEEEVKVNLASSKEE